MIRSKYSSLIGMVIGLFLFFGIDRWLDRQVRIAQKNAHFQPYMIWIIVSGLAICALFYALSWLTLFRSQRSVSISIIFIVVGLIVYTYPVLYLWTPQWIPWLNLPYISAYNTPLPYTGIFITALGILHLSLPFVSVTNAPSDIH
jgi:hypothetical protein